MVPFVFGKEKDKNDYFPNMKNIDLSKFDKLLVFDNQEENDVKRA